MATSTHEAYAEAAVRLYGDGISLHAKNSVATATHLYGLAAECALKECLRHFVKSTADMPHTHLPDLVNDAKRLAAGRKFKGLIGLLSKGDYMDGWRVDNRYWATATFSAAQCNQYREHARRTLIAAGLGGIA